MSSKKRMSSSRVAFNILNYGFFFIFAFLCFYPLWYVMVYTISDPQLAATGVTFLPKGFSLFNFTKLLQLDGVFHAFGVSVVRTVVGTKLLNTFKIEIEMWAAL